MEEPHEKVDESGGDPRLAEAMAALAEFAANDEDVPTFLARHAHLRDLLEPMVLVPTDDTGDPAVSPSSGPREDPAHGPRDSAPEASRLGKFRLVRHLGSGAMGTVYAARDTVMHREVALKVLAPHLLLDPRARARFMREAELMARLGNPHIVRVFEVGESDGQPFLAMERIDGVSLADVVRALEEEPARTSMHGLSAAMARLRARQTGAAPPPAKPTKEGEAAGADAYVRLVVGWAIEVADALACAHGAGVLHRDVKPSNILITADHRAMLTDFGLARQQGESGLTITGEFAGTLSYSAPEQFASSTQLDGRADVFSLGVTLYELLTLERPFAAETAVEVQQRILRQEPDAVNERNHRVPRDLAAVVGRALEKDRARRYPSAAAFAEDLRRWRAGYPVVARPVSRFARARRWATRNPLASAFLGTLLLTTLVVSALAWHARRNELRTRELLRESLGDRVSGELKAIRNQAAALFPTTPAQARPLTELLDAAEVLLRVRPELESQLVELRQRGHRDHRDDDGSRADRARWQADLDDTIQARLVLERRLEEHDAEAADATITAAIADERQELVQRESRLHRIVDSYRRYRFTAPIDRLRHDRLEDVILDLEAFASEDDELAYLRRRLASARAMAAGLREHQDGWQTAIAAVAADPRFVGMQLTPQPGLIPLGPDPVSGLQEFAHADSGAVPPRHEDGRVAIDSTSAIVFVLLPPGKATTAHGDQIDLAAFLCSKFEVSIAQMRRLAQGMPRDDLVHPRWSIEPERDPCHPAAQVTWLLAAHLLPRFDLALPTAAQWEYACRAGTTTDWHTGDAPHSLVGVANFRWTETDPPELWAVDRRGGANAFGLFHMHGNVTEWLDDHIGVFTDAATGRLKTFGFYRWLAGGHFAHEPETYTRCHDFDQINATLAAETVGIRPVRALNVQPDPAEPAAAVAGTAEATALKR